MTPLKTTLRGAIGIQAGLGRDELAIDLAATLPDDAVTVAIRGDNGTGKSTLLNLGMSPWLAPPMLPGNIYDHFGDQGERILEWTHGDERYRSSIQYRQTKRTKTTKAYLHVFRDGDWQPVTMPDHTTSDGKTRTYDACLSDILGAQSVYYLSAFRAQKAPRLADYDDPKGLMRDLLHLYEPKELSDKAHDIWRELKRAHEGIKGQAEALDKVRKCMDDVELAIPHLEQGVAESKERKQRATESHARAKAEYDHTINDDLDQERIRDERRKIKARIAGQTQQLSDDLVQVDQGRAAVQRRRNSIESDADRESRNIESDIRAAEQRIRRDRALLERAIEIRKSADDLQVLKHRLVEMESEEKKLRQDCETKRAAGVELTGIGATLKVVMNEGRALRTHLDDLNRRAEFANQVPCGGAAPYDTCPALRDAIQAAENALSIDTERKQKLTEYRLIEVDYSRIRVLFEAMGDPYEALRNHVDELQNLRELISRTQETASLLPPLESAEGDIKAAEEQVATLIERLAHIKETESERLFGCTKEENALLDRKATIQQTAEKKIISLRQEIDALPFADGSGAVEQALKALSHAENESYEANKALEDHTANLAQHQAERDSLQRKINAGADISERAKRLSTEIAHWDLLSRGLRGVIDLSIEDAGPGIAEIANRLLCEAYGPRFTLRIVTQREQQNGKVVECFDISVIDAETDIETSIVHKSGGETVWLDKALTDAVGLYHQEAANMHFGTLFADEAEDGLTAERKLMFYKMDRAALNLGGYRRKFFVSHNPDAWSMADAVIDLAEYRAVA